jgi:prolipoprotein diacylglyceryl transferase
MPYDLSFVNLGIKIQSLKNSINILGLDIAFYGIIIACGMLLGLVVATRDARRRGQNPDDYSDFALYAIIFSIIGARLYYVIFSWDLYKDNPIQILNIRGGGLAIYGGVIAAALTLYFFCRIKKKSFLEMADTGVLGLVTGQILGRWGNFFNMEAFGSYTNNLFAMQLRKDLVNPAMISENLVNNIVNVNGVEYIQVHPTFLYESTWNLFLLIFLLWYRKKQTFKGEIFYLYLGGYGLGRFIIEGLRTDSLMLFGTGIAVSQGLALLCFIISTIMIIINKRNK